MIGDNVDRENNKKEEGDVSLQYLQIISPNASLPQNQGILALVNVETTCCFE
jgi:hypothetical protein